MGDEKNTCEWKIISDTIFDDFFRCSNCGYEINVETITEDMPPLKPKFCLSCGGKIKYVVEGSDGDDED